MADPSIDRLFDTTNDPPTTRKEAKALGSKRYDTGEPCSKGHLSPRHTASGVCCACDVEKKRARYAAAPEKYRARTQQWRLDNPQKHKEILARWYVENRELVLEKLRREYPEQRQRILSRRKVLYAQNPALGRAKCKAWREANRDAWKTSARKAREKHIDRVYERNRARRAREYGAEGSHTAEDIRSIRRQQGDACLYCAAPLSGKGHIDHRTPLSRGGSNWPDNLQLLCVSCNCSKGALTHDEFMQRRRGQT